MEAILSCVKLRAPQKKYHIGERLGGGGMADVFRGSLTGAEGFSRPIAVKKIHPSLSQDPDFAQMFVREAQLVSQLNHPNIVSVLDFDRDEEGQLFLVMELVEGKDLQQLFQVVRLSLAVIVHIIADLLRALAFAQQYRSESSLLIIHRDISPQNILISWGGVVKLTDFGIAKAMSAASLTRTGIVKGKAAYLSPEQIGCQRLDVRSDLFAVGIILHELLTHQRLFGIRGAPEAVIVRRVLEHTIASPRVVRPEISQALEHVCMRLLERDRTRRWPSALAALEALLGCPEVSPRGDLELAKVMARSFPPTSATDEASWASAQLVLGSRKGSVGRPRALGWIAWILALILLAVAWAGRKKDEQFARVATPKVESADATLGDAKPSAILYTLGESRDAGLRNRWVVVSRPSPSPKRASKQVFRYDKDAGFVFEPDGSEMPSLGNQTMAPEFD